MALDAKRKIGAPDSVADVSAPTRSRALGRPSVTSHAQIERAAFELFERQGFEGTTLDDIAAAVGVSRRTLFRYFDSKNDIPWGQFDQSLTEFARILRSFDPDLPLAETIHRGVRAFNEFPDEARTQHRARMDLILNTPALQAHSTIKYQQWRRIIAEFVAERTGASVDDIAVRTIGHVSLALSLSAYEQWLTATDLDLLDLLDLAMRTLRVHMDGME